MKTWVALSRQFNGTFISTLGFDPSISSQYKVMFFQVTKQTNGTLMIFSSETKEWFEFKVHWEHELCYIVEECKFLNEILYVRMYPNYVMGISTVDGSCLCVDLPESMIPPAVSCSFPWVISIMQSNNTPICEYGDSNMGILMIVGS
ncbi:hypothetical protein QJS04_geneDACA022046 [Acorus gramineus]|uniref:Uncharacterized protein n=1 Tax=Acorus gramineus TaxID=55184 RepID=A0AAV9B7H9_ACOGR|nr:hypothetical protein QJS04_geneDACA022046 [Acorus gramineus]